MPVLIYDSETMKWKEKERFRIRTVQMENLRDLIAIRRMDRVPNERIRKLCRMAKGVNERIEKDVLHGFSNVEMMENDRTAKRVYVGECAASHPVGRPQKSWIDTVKDYLKKRGLDVRQARRIEHDSCECRGFVRGNAWGVTREMNP